MGVRVIENVVVHREANRFCGNPNLTRLDTGELLVGFRWTDGRIQCDWDPTLRPVQKKAATIEELCAAEPRVIYDVPGSLTPYSCQLPDGSVLCFFNRSDVITPEEAARSDRAVLRYRQQSALVAIRRPIQVLRSTDGAETWEEFSRIELEGYPMHAAFRGNVIEWDDELLFSVYAASEQVGHAATSLLVRSPDMGATWEEIATIAHDPDGPIGFNETFLYRTPSDRLIAFLRTSDADGHLYVATSDDRGRSWSAYRDTGVYGFPHDALRLPDDRVLLSYGCRREPYGVRARVLDPECSDIAGAEEVIIRGDGSSGAVGYPASVLMDDGTVFMVYYHRTADELSWIGGSIIEIT